MTTVNRYFYVIMWLCIRFQLIYDDNVNDNDIDKDKIRLQHSASLAKCHQVRVCVFDGSFAEPFYCCCCYY